MKFKPANNHVTYKKMAVYGSAGQGKTILALSAPGKKLVLDSEGGTLNYSSLTPFDVLHTQSFGEIKEAIEELLSKPPTEETTLIIDSASLIWSGLQQSMLENKLKEKGMIADTGTEKVQFLMADWAILKRYHKHILSSLMALKCHVVCTFRESEVRDEHTFKPTGVYVPEWERNSPYTFDFVARISNRSLTFTKGRMAKNGKIVDMIGKKVTIPTVEDGKDLPKIWESIFGLEEAPTAAHPISKSNGDGEKLAKDPEVLRISHEIRSVLLPKRAITNEQLESYLKTKLDNSGERIALEGADGKVHLSAMSLKSILWLKGILEDDGKSMLLISKLKGEK